MEVYTSEKEQIEQLKKWLKSYGPAVILGVVIAVCISVGWGYWRRHSLQEKQSASVLYINMMGTALDNLQSDASQLATTLSDKYPRSVYGQLANLLIAKQKVAKNELASAQKHLQAVIDKTDIKALKQTAKVRLAQVYIAEKKANKALQLLKTVDDKAFLGMIEETRGDAYVALKQNKQAKKAYQAAKLALPNNAASLVEIKLANLA